MMCRRSSKYMIPALVTKWDRVKTERKYRFDKNSTISNNADHVFSNKFAQLSHNFHLQRLQ